MIIESITGFIATVAGSGALGSLFTYLSGRKKRKLEYRAELNAQLRPMQETIDLLAAKNNDLWEMVLSLREQNADILQELEMLRRLYENETGKTAPSPHRKNKKENGTRNTQ